MRILYLDCFSGISGDMAVGALTDLGISPSTFEWELAKLDLGDCHLHFERQTRGGISGVKFDIHAGATHNASYDKDDLAQESDHVLKHTGEIEEIHEHTHHDHEHPHQIHEHAHHEHEHFHYDDEHTHHDHGIRHHEHGDVHPHGLQHHPSRNFSEIRKLIDGSELSSFVKQHATSIFRRIANAESKIHGASVEEVQFHEVGALDSIVDVVLSCVGIEALQVERIYFSSLIDGKGSFRSSHGMYPLPAPAVLEILQDIPIRQADIPFELITPTGAAIVAEFHDSVGVLPEMRPAKIGYGLGTRELAGRPNVLRAVLGQLEEASATEQIVELQTNLDDLSPEILGAVQDRLFQAGALDVFFTPIQMKKSRPATMLSVLCDPPALEKIQEIIFAETSTFGIRYREMNRKTLDREWVEVKTSAGQIQVKIGRHAGRILQVAPEFESCRAAAQQSSLPLKRVYELAIEAFWNSSFASGTNSSPGLEKVVELPH
jgi:pyridinium-3,5-bisthiocarboxylic acid mononucleotide nickel chelatase